MFCEKCGKKMQPGAAFCGACGAQAEVEHKEYGEETVTVNSSQNAGPAFVNRNYQEQMPPIRQGGFSTPYNQPVMTEKEKNNTPLIAILSGVIVLLVVGLTWGIITLVNMDKESEDAYEAPTVKSSSAQGAEKEGDGSEGLFEEEVEIKGEGNTNQTAEVTTTPVPTQTPYQTQAASPQTGGDYIIADSNSRTITSADLNGLSEWEIRIARNEIYARKGRIFSSSELDSYFRGKSWYIPSVPTEQFNDSYLSALELANAQFIVQYEKEHGLNQ